MSSESTISQEEKEAQLNNRIEEIRRKNAALQKRYDEVQADKKNADVVEGRQIASRPPREPSQRSTAAGSTKSNVKQRLSVTERLGSRVRSDQSISSEQPVNSREQRPQRLKKEDAPPPDPSYSFLADRTRDREIECRTVNPEEESEETSKAERREGSRRHPGNFGGKDFSNTKTEMQKRRSYNRDRDHFSRRSTNSKMDMELSMTGRERRDYERWRSERKGIDEARVNRQRTTSGEWGRQWDKEKDFDKEVSVEPTSAAWQDRKKEYDSCKKSAYFKETFDRRHGRSSSKKIEDDDEKKGKSVSPETVSSRTVVVNDDAKDSLNVSIVNELADSTSMALQELTLTDTTSSDDAVNKSPPLHSPPPPPIPPRVTRGWGSDDAWEDTSTWLECEVEDPQLELDDNDDDAFEIQIQTKSELKNEKIQSDDLEISTRQVMAADHALVPALDSSAPSFHDDVSCASGQLPSDREHDERRPNSDNNDDEIDDHKETEPIDSPNAKREVSDDNDDVADTDGNLAPPALVHEGHESPAEIQSELKSIQVHTEESESL